MTLVCRPLPRNRGVLGSKVHNMNSKLKESCCEFCLLSLPCACPLRAYALINHRRLKMTVLWPQCLQGRRTAMVQSNVHARQCLQLFVKTISRRWINYCPFHACSASELGELRASKSVHFWRYSNCSASRSAHPITLRSNFNYK